MCRAISTATGLNYSSVNKLLTLTASHYGCDRLCVCCYHHLLEDILGYKRHTCRNGETVADVAEMYPDEKILIRINAHLTSSVKGTILDIWDCSQKPVDCFWLVK